MKSMRRILMVPFILMVLSVSVRAGTGYTDVPAEHWAYSGVMRATELKLTGGVGGGYFGLGWPITRAEYAAMLCRLMGWTMLTPKQGSFDDNQNPKAWYYSAVETAYANGVLPKIGTSAGVGESLARDELAAMTVRALGYAGLAGIVQDDCPFDDVSTNRGYITLAYHMGLIHGADGDRFVPTVATREQAALVLLRAYDALHADLLRQTVSEAPKAAILVASLEDRAAPIPMCPRAPLVQVYRAVLKAGRGGAVALNVVPYNATTGRALAQVGLNIMRRQGARIYRSARYASSYAILGDNVVWFEAEEDIEEKLMLCRLMGIGRVYLVS